MGSRMTMERAKLILAFVVQWNKMPAARRPTSPNAWVAVKLSCRNESEAGRTIEKAQKMIGLVPWNEAVTAARQSIGVAADASTAAAAGEHNPAVPTMQRNVDSPTVVAEKLVRGWLESQVRRNQELLKLCQPGMNAGGNRRAGAEAAAIIKLTGSLLDHLDADAKQARADDAEDQAAIDQAEGGL